MIAVEREEVFLVLLLNFNWTFSKSSLEIIAGIPFSIFNSLPVSFPCLSFLPKIKVPVYFSLSNVSLILNFLNGFPNLFFNPNEFNLSAIFAYPLPSRKRVKINFTVLASSSLIMYFLSGVRLYPKGGNTSSVDTF